MNTFRIESALGESPARTLRVEAPTEADAIAAVRGWWEAKSFVEWGNCDGVREAVQVKSVEIENADPACRCQNEDFGSFALQTHIELLEMRVKELESQVCLPSSSALEDYRNREAKVSRITRLESAVFHPDTPEGS